MSDLSELLKDPETTHCLSEVTEPEAIRAARVPGVKSVLVVLSSRAMAFDTDSMRHKIRQAYPEAASYFMGSSGSFMGVEAPSSVDLVIDLTGPGERGGWLLSRKLRRLGRVVAGRNAGPFRKRTYDRVFDEQKDQELLPVDLLSRERFVQKQVLGMVGISVLPVSDPVPDLGHSLATQLPPFKKL